MTRSRPERTCIGCRQAAERGELIRFASVDGRVLPDPAARLPGRGAWLHPRAACLERAIARRAFPRALKAPVRVGQETIDFIHTWPRSA